MPAAECLPTPRPVRTLVHPAGAPVPVAALIDAGQPVLLKGAAAHWPLVRAAASGDDAVIDLLLQADRGLPMTGYVGDAAISGRFHYNTDVSGMNFSAERASLADFAARIMAARDEAAAPAIYLGSTDIDTYLPGLRDAHPLTPDDDVWTRHPPLASVWIGNRTIAATHWDMSNNVAVCVAGRRRFTLFPPDQVSNLYPGPIEPTPAGQVVSMVDLAAPDVTRYPGIVDALAAAQVADMLPGDVLVYPALWWHQVEALSAFNVLVNYWWNAAADHMDTPMTTLLHALLSLRDRPNHEKAAWRAMFDHYVFGPADRAAAHLPAAARGPLGPMDAPMARRLRALVANRLAR